MNSLVSNVPDSIEVLVQDNALTNFMIRAMFWKTYRPDFSELLQVSKTTSCEKDMVSLAENTIKCIIGKDVIEKLVSHSFDEDDACLARKIGTTSILGGTCTSNSIDMNIPFVLGLLYRLKSPRTSLLSVFVVQDASIRK